MSSVSLPAELVGRYRRLFGFYDRDGDGRHTLEGDFEPVAVRMSRRWQGRPSRFPDLLGLLLETYRHENARRDQNHDGTVDAEEFLASHGRVFAAFGADPQAAREFMARSAGGFFDVLDLDGDGQLELDDLAAFAAAYGHPTAGIAANLDRMLAALGLPPGRHLFDGVELVKA